jgi:protein involved in polysaccharide export with SLBB domain
MGNWLARRWVQRIFVLGLFVGFLFQVPGSGYSADSVAYKLGTGDKVRITIFNEKDLSGDFDVNDQGVVALPLIGQVSLVGKTISEAEAFITEKYGQNYLVNPRVNVEVLNYRPFFILGEVKSPGSYPFINGMTVVNAVALAGGYTPRANHDRIMIKHISDPAAEQPTREDSVVLPGDVIRVLERFF